jgi:hypothetical protein
MIHKYIKNIALAGTLLFSAAGCVNDLDLEPKNEVTSASVYQDFANYKNVLAKLYGGYSLTGQSGPAGRGDVAGIDEGASSYVRTYWQLQELPTDEAVLAWVNDPGVPGLNNMDWTASNALTKAMYYRIFYQITLANEFIRETSDERLADRSITGQEADMARVYRAEARFLRAFSYWHAMDLFGDVPFVTEEDAVGAFFPEQINRADLFEYIEAELLDLENDLVAPMANEYGRVDQAAAWTLLTKLYLNANVYTGTPRYDETITFAKRVMEAGFGLEADYQDLFLADNHTAQGIIFPITFDGLNSQSYGGTTFLTHAAVGGAMDAADFGINGGWFGLRTTEALVDNFAGLPENADSPDERAMFFTEGQSLEIEDISSFTDGYAITKYRNITSAGDPGSDPTGNFVDIDFPMFRLADVYLMYAEAVERGGAGGDMGTAVDLINQLRQRAYGDESGNISAAELTLDFILDERARELYWEAHRRTDLIRFGLFTGSEYLWPWKGGVMEGRAVADCRVLYPLAADDVIANPNLEQNDCYQ